MHYLRLLLTAALLLFTAAAAQAQIIPDPTTWTYEAKKTGENKYQLIFHLKLKKDWHIFSLRPGGDGMSPSPTFSFDKAPGVKLIGAVKEKGKLLSKVFVPGDPASNYFEDKVDYVQDIVVAGNAVVTGIQKYQTCKEVCLAPKKKPFQFRIP